jgi:hypothetical protein
MEIKVFGFREGFRAGKEFRGRYLKVYRKV